MISPRMGERPRNKGDLTTPFVNDRVGEFQRMWCIVRDLDGFVALFCFALKSIAVKVCLTQHALPLCWNHQNLDSMHATCCPRLLLHRCVLKSMRIDQFATCYCDSGHGVW